MALEFEDFVTGLTEETTPDNAADFLVIVDTSGSDVNKVKPSNLLGADLTAIKALSPSNDDVLQRKAGAWTNRTVAQVKTDLGLTGTNSGDQNTFGTVAVSGQSDVVADAANDTLTLAAGSGIAITTDASTDTVSIASTVTGNATHTGEVTGATSLTVDKTAITGKTLVTAAVGDHVMIADASDSDNLKKVTVQTIVDLAGGGVDVGDTIGSATAGSVFFAGTSGVLAQNNAALKWVDADTQLQLTAGGATKTPLLVTLAGSQSADALQIKDSGGTTIASIDAVGRATFGRNGDAAQSLVIRDLNGNNYGAIYNGAVVVGDQSYAFAAAATETRVNAPSGTVGLFIGNSEYFRIDANATAGNTRMLVYDVDNGTLERVSVGAADSGGTGFKLLRIPN